MQCTKQLANFPTANYIQTTQCHNYHQIRMVSSKETSEFTVFM